MTKQVESHLYCASLNEDVKQCLIYDSNDKDAKIIGVEYIISAKLFAGNFTKYAIAKKFLYTDSNLPYFRITRRRKEILAFSFL